MSANADTLISHLKRRSPGAKFKCVYESCAWGFALHRKLTAAGMDCIVVHAADVSTSDKERRRKTDPVDALKLARGLEDQSFEGIYVPDEQQQKERNLIRYRQRLTWDLNRCKNRLKSLLRYQGYTIPDNLAKSNWSKNFINWVKQQADEDVALQGVLLLELEQIELLRELKLKTEKKLRELMQIEKYKTIAALLMTVPGIGPINAMLYALELGDTSRFKSFHELNSFVGLCPDKFSSGEKDQSLGITRRGNRALRSALIEAAWVAIRVDPAMLDAYKEFTKRMAGNKAIVRIARKLLRRIRAVLISKIPYQKGVIE
jgi:transposase